MSGASNATCYETNAYAIGSTFNATEYELNKDLSAQPPTDCTPYTGNEYKSISATKISKGDPATNAEVTGI